MRGGDSGWREEMDSLPGGGNERAASGCYQCFPVLLLAMPPPWSSWAEGVGIARTVDRRPEGLGFLFFCKSWWRFRVLEPSHMNGGWEGRRRTETPWVEIRGFRVLCVFQKREGVSAILPRRSGPEEAGVGSAENPTSPPPRKCSPCPWDTHFQSEREQFQKDRHRQQQESSERSHGMIKGKWRIDLGGKIKGAKSVALGSAVTKRGQDNSFTNV